MNQSRSETSRVSRPRPVTMLRHAGGRGVGHLVQRNHNNWHLMAAHVRGRLWACPSDLTTGGVLP